MKYTIYIIYEKKSIVWKYFIFGISILFFTIQQWKEPQSLLPPGEVGG